MRIPAALFACFCLSALAGCSHQTAPPTGRWEGTYDAGDTLVAARMEITAKGQIFVSAPNAENIASTSNGARAAIRQRLASGLAAGWDDVTPIQLDFDGQTFRKPGGIAPQAEWNSSTHRMTLIVYLGRGDGFRIPMRAVKTFSPDPFPGG
ncbi:MAG: hypothetical protein JSR55_14060 [Proteobacteria bacterium]|nr:hypothetical protein [Pseudomonadota bacterium]